MDINFITRFFQFRSRPVRTKRFEILLPLNYNDGKDIEPEKFDATAEELSDRFGGATLDMVRITGTWKYGGTRYRDTMIRLRVDTKDTDATSFFRTRRRFGKSGFNKLIFGLLLMKLK